MSKTYRYDSSTNKAQTFVDITNLKRTLVLSNERKVVRPDNGPQWDLTRASVVLTTPDRITDANCVDKCGPSTEGTRLIRLETSTPLASKTEFLADLEELKEIIENLGEDFFVKGLKMPMNVDIIIA